MQQAVRRGIFDNVQDGIGILFLRAEYNEINQLRCRNSQQLGKKAANGSSERLSSFVRVLQKSNEPKRMCYQGKILHSCDNALDLHVLEYIIDMTLMWTLWTLRHS